MSNRNPRRRSFQFKIALKLFGVCFFLCLTFYLLFATSYWLVSMWTAAAAFILFYMTMKLINRSEKKLSDFLDAITQNDFSITFSENERHEDYELNSAFNQLNQVFINLRAEKESQHHLLQSIVEHGAVPFICFDPGTDEIILENQAAKDLFSIPHLINLEVLKRFHPKIPGILRSTKNDEKIPLDIHGRHGKTINLSLVSREIRFENRMLKLVVFHDVSSELALKEAETWQKLLRVLTHEISNSAIPLSTLSSYIYEMMMSIESEGRQITGEEKKDLMQSLRTIDQRSRSLKQFVSNFRNLNNPPEPNLKWLAIRDLTEEVSHLFAKEFENEKIQFENILPKDDLVHVDKDLTLQVLINVIKNSIESMADRNGNKSIKISIERSNQQHLYLHVTDTGCGIGKKELEQIFIPFYSTKKGGSGIGLSLSRQIMQKQKGDIFVSSHPGKGSTFTLSFMGMAEKKNTLL